MTTTNKINLHKRQQFFANKGRSFAIVLGLLLVIFSSCQNNVFYEQNEKINRKGWDMNERLTFQVNVTNLSEHYDFSLNVRNTTDYLYSNVFFFIKTTFPDGRFAKDTVECTLAMPEGEWTGKGSGRIKDNRFYFKRNVAFPMRGSYKFEIEHAMRDEKVIGLSDIGLRITHSGK